MNIIKITYLEQNYSADLNNNINSALVEYCQSHNAYYDCRYIATSHMLEVTVFLMIDFSTMNLQYGYSSSYIASKPLYKCMLFTVDDSNEFVPDYQHTPFYIYESMTYDVLPYTIKQTKLFSEVFGMKFPWLI